MSKPTMQDLYAELSTAAAPPQHGLGGDLDTLPPDVFDIPSAVLRHDIQIAYNTRYDEQRHTHAASRVEWLVWFKTHRPVEFAKLLSKFVPQVTIDMVPKPTTTFRLSVPIKALDIVSENPAIPLAEDNPIPALDILKT